MNVIDQALEYAALGWHLLPGIPDEKRPYVKWAEASNDPAKVISFFEQYPLAEILVLCGPSKLAVLDLDGPWPDMPLLPYTWEQETPRGGIQYLFSDPEGIVPTTASKLHDKVDTRGVGGLFVAPSVNSPKRRWRTKTPAPSVWPSNEFPTLGRPRVASAEHSDENGLWQPIVGVRHPNEDCPGAYHLTTGRQPRLGIVEFPNGRIEARCWSGCSPEEVNPLLIEAGRYTAEQLGYSEPPEEPEGGSFITVADLMAIRPPEWLIEPYLQEGALVMLAAKFNTGKTFVAVEWSLRLSSSGKRVLYLALEGLTGLQSRVRAWKEHNELDPGGILFNPRNFSLNLLSSRSVDSLCADISAAGGFDLVVVDNLGEAVPGDENDSEVVGQAMHALNQIRRASGGTVLDLHNSGHGGQVRARGHSKMLDVHDTVIYLEQVEGSIHGLKVISGKERNAERFVTRKAMLKPVADSLVAVMGGMAVAEQNPYYAAVKLGHVTVAAIEEYLNKSHGTVVEALQKLVEAGDLQVTKMGKQNLYSSAWDLPLD